MQNCILHDQMKIHECALQTVSSKLIGIYYLIVKYGKSVSPNHSSGDHIHTRREFSSVTKILVLRNSMDEHIAYMNGISTKSNVRSHNLSKVSRFLWVGQDTLKKYTDRPRLTTGIFEKKNFYGSSTPYLFLRGFPPLFFGLFALFRLKKFFDWDLIECVTHF